ncbi:MAG: hypothetical protein OXG49_13495 [Chloroflexi bacterium]|nr:hypothetical protein [Chloroflexota bacterium]
MDHGCAYHLHEYDQQNGEQAAINDSKLAFQADLNLMYSTGQFPL